MEQENKQFNAQTIAAVQQLLMEQLRTTAMAKPIPSAEARAAYPGVDAVGSWCAWDLARMERLEELITALGTQPDPVQLAAAPLCAALCQTRAQIHQYAHEVEAYRQAMQHASGDSAALLDVLAQSAKTKAPMAVQAFDAGIAALSCITGRVKTPLPPQVRQLLLQAYHLDIQPALEAQKNNGWQSATYKMRWPEYSSNAWEILGKYTAWDFIAKSTRNNVAQVSGMDPKEALAKARVGGVPLQKFAQKHAANFSPADGSQLELLMLAGAVLHDTQPVTIPCLDEEGVERPVRLLQGDTAGLAPHFLQSFLRAFELPVLEKELPEKHLDGPELTLHRH